MSKTCMVSLAMALLAAAACGAAVPPTTSYAIGDGELGNAVRAEQCIANATHCHCSVHPRAANACVKPSETTAGECSMGTCLGGLRCDCASDKVCKKAARPAWVRAGGGAAPAAGAAFKCEESVVDVPAEVIGYTADFEVNADGAFTLYVDGTAVDAGDGSKRETFRSTAQLYASSVIAVEVFGASAAGPALKLRYNIDGSEHSMSRDARAARGEPRRGRALGLARARSASSDRFFSPVSLALAVLLSLLPLRSRRRHVARERDARVGLPAAGVRRGQDVGQARGRRAALGRAGRGGRLEDGGRRRRREGAVHAARRAEHGAVGVGGGGAAAQCVLL